jgi:hypothetical protein
MSFISCCIIPSSWCGSARKTCDLQALLVYITYIIAHSVVVGQFESRSPAIS